MTDSRSKANSAQPSSNAPGHGPWIICDFCDGEGSWLDGIDLAVCLRCGGDGGHYDDAALNTESKTDSDALKGKST